MTIRRIEIGQLRVGMYLHAIDGPWLDHALWRTRFLIDEAGAIAKIVESGAATVQIDTARGLDLPEDPPVAAPTRAGAQHNSSTAVAQAPGVASVVEGAVVESAPPPVAIRRSLAEEAQEARRIIHQSRREVVRMFSEARLGQVPDIAAVTSLTDEISASVGRNHEALISLVRLKTADDYTYMHSVAVCGLMIALARELGFDGDEVRSAGVAGLLHDIGKTSIPNSILNKPGKLSDEEFATVREHPVAGHRILLQVRGIDPAALDVCLNHHEKHGGGGYPGGLMGERISLFARMGAVCDVYDAVTSERAYNKGWDPSDAIRQMAGWKGHFDPLVFQAFVRAVGIYPVGSLVRLASGRLGVVLEQSGGSLLTPDVRVFFDMRSQQPIRPQRVSLANGSRERIVARENPVDWKFAALNDYWLKDWNDDAH